MYKIPMPRNFSIVCNNLINVEKTRVNTKQFHDYFELHFTLIAIFFKTNQVVAKGFKNDLMEK